MAENKSQECCGGKSCAAEIHEHMDVVDARGSRVGKVDRVEGDSLKLTKNDSPDGRHHFVPMSWISNVDAQVHLKMNSDQVTRDWK